MRLDNKEKILKTINNQNNEKGELEAPWWKESSVDNRNSLYERRRYRKDKNNRNSRRNLY